MSKVVVGLSGGVDSAVTAKILIEKGYEVVGVSMVMCAYNELAAQDARRIAEHLNIDFHILDVREKFDESVVKYFSEEYLAGRTPNPCIRCNELIKWDRLLSFADEIGAEYIATGHYARIKEHENGRRSVVNSEAASKDQTYVLYRLSQEMLSRTLMPLGEYDKDIVRKKALEADIPVADKKDSQDICFIPDGDYAKFLKEYLGSEALPGPGNYVDEKGTVIGKHKGYTCYTVGQRKGLEIAVGHRVFVKEIHPETNEVVISDEDVYSKELKAEDIFCMSQSLQEFSQGISYRGYAKIRYAHKGEWCNFEIVKNSNTGKDELDVVFDKPVRAVTPGQAVVIYDSDKNDRSVILGATIV